MPKVAPAQTNFTGGEFAPRLYGRIDTDRYKTGLATCYNALPQADGPWDSRSGTYYVAEVKDSAAFTRLVPFEFSTTQAYILEFGNNYVRFFKDYGQIISGTPVELVTTYATADLPQLQFVQSADVLYVFHPSYVPRKITRTSHTSWTITTITWLDGPYLSTNTTATTLTASAATGAITLTASSTTGINNGDGFKTTDVGRLIRIKIGTNPWGYVRITGWTSTTVVSATVVSTLTAATATTNWRLGLFSDTTGYPGSGTFYEDRLAMGGVRDYPQRIDCSKSGDYENMAPSALDGTIAASDAVALSLNADKVNAVRWLMEDEKGLLIGTAGAEWRLGPTTTTEAFSAVNARAGRAESRGCAPVAPVKAGKATLFVQSSKRRLYELAFVFEADGFLADDLTSLSRHITEGGIDEIVWQKQPFGILWAVRGDGALLSLTYERSRESIKAGWAKHVLGGYSDSGQTAPAEVESIAVIPSPDGTRDDLWMIVKRYINGATKRYVEYMKPFFDDEIAQEDAFFVDCGLTYDGAPDTIMSGLDHLEGQTVAVLADGMVQTNKTVTGGEITLDQAASVVHVGLPYVSRGKNLRIEAGAADGTALGKTRRIQRVNFLVHRSLGLSIGPDFDNLTPVIFRTAGDDLGEPTELYSGIVSETFEGDYNTEGYVCWERNQPLPLTILAFAPQLLEIDR